MADIYTGDPKDLCPYANQDATVLYDNRELGPDCLHCAIDEMIDKMFLKEVEDQTRPDNE